MLIARASAFATRFYRRDGEQVGVLTIARWLGAARNARLRGNPDDVATIELGGKTYRLEWEFLDPPGPRRGVRWFLMDRGDTLATGSAHSGERKRRWEVEVQGERYVLLTRGRWFTLHYDLLKDGANVGAVSETTRMFALAKTYEVTCPVALGEPIQAFLVHLVTRTTQ
jgi:hypothetical protein